MSAKTKPINLSQFKKKVRAYYRAHGRHDLPWRTKLSPYRVLVSELMLQQTQVSRVIPKFVEFMHAFPNSKALARASLAEVLQAWQGLGYNRRAKFLWQTANIIHHEYHDVFPKAALAVGSKIKLPGIGTNTAGAIAAYAYNMRVVFIETNIRRVFIHEFFKGASGVSDKDLLPYVAAAAATEKNPREWYWALMDYGSMLGRDAKLVNPNRQSKHYVVQSKFEGSRRQIRGNILKYLTSVKKGATSLQIAMVIALPEKTLAPVLTDLVSEQLITVQGKKYKI